MFPLDCQKNGTIWFDLTEIRRKEKWKKIHEELSKSNMRGYFFKKKLIRGTENENVSILEILIHQSQNGVQKTVF